MSKELTVLCSWRISIFPRQEQKNIINLSLLVASWATQWGGLQEVHKLIDLRSLLIFFGPFFWPFFCWYIKSNLCLGRLYLTWSFVLSFIINWVGTQPHYCIKLPIVWGKWAGLNPIKKTLNFSWATFQMSNHISSTEKKESFPWQWPIILAFCVWKLFDFPLAVSDSEDSISKLASYIIYNASHCEGIEIVTIHSFVWS